MRALLPLAIALVLAAAAAADIGVVTVSRTSARPGDVVVVRFGGYAGEAPRMPAYLVLHMRAPRATACRRNAVCAPFAARAPQRWPYVFIGRIRFAPPASGRLRFRVPRVPAGAYRFVVYCAPCYKGPGGSLIDSGPTFVVR